MTQGYYRVLTGKGKDQTLAAGPGFLVSMGVECGSVCSPTAQSRGRCLESCGAPGSIWGRAWACSEPEPPAFAASPFVPQLGTLSPALLGFAKLALSLGQRAQHQGCSVSFHWTLMPVACFAQSPSFPWTLPWGKAGGSQPLIRGLTATPEPWVKGAWGLHAGG